MRALGRAGGKRKYSVLAGGVLVALTATAFHFHRLASLPPGVDPDAAANGWLALKWLRDGILPFWIAHAGAPEPLIVWGQALATWILGPSVWALRSVSVTATVLACVAGYSLGLEVGRGLSPSTRVAGAWFAGMALAANPAYTEIARTGLRATLLPACVAIIAVALLMGLRTGRGRYFVGAGLALGGAAYTYLAARFLPIAVGLFLVCVWFLRPAWRNRARKVAGMLSVGMVVLAPQLVFFARYPATFWTRAQGVTWVQNPLYAQQGLGGVVAQKLLNMGLMLGVHWSGQYNQSGWPLLLPVPLLGFLIGLIVLLRRWRDPALVLLGLLAITLLLPDVVAGDRPNPQPLRIIGSFIPIHVLSGLGLAAGLAWLSRRRWALVAVAGGVAAVIVGWAWVAWYDLSAPRLEASTYAWYARGEVAEAAFINQSAKAVIMPLLEYSRSTVAYLTSKSLGVTSGLDAAGRARWPDLDSVVMLWPEDASRGRAEGVSYLYDPAALVLVEGGHAYLMPPAGADVASLLARCVSQPLEAPKGEVVARYCEVPFAALKFPAAISPTWPANVVFAGRLKLQGVSAPTSVLSPSQSVGVTSYWTASAPALESYTYFVHVLNDRQERVAGEDVTPGYGLMGTDVWRPAQWVPLRQLVRLPEQLPAGRYWLELGWYSPLSSQRAPVTSGVPGENRAVVGPLKVPLHVSATLTNEVPLSADFGGELALRGYQLQVLPDRLAVALRLQALRPPADDYTFFLHLESPAGELVAQQDVQPLDGQYPTSLWDTGETVVAQLSVGWPASLPSGLYKIWLGMYYWPTGNRLSITAPGKVVDSQRLLLATFSR